MVKLRAARWLWPHRIPVGELTLIAGPTDSGKSLLIADIIARVTTGAEWLDGSGRAPFGEVLVLGEDSISAIQNPRLTAAGADLGRVRHWTTRSFCLGSDLNALIEDLAAYPNTRLVVFDPLGDVISAQSYAKVRMVLGSLRDLARRKGIAVIGVGHPPKGLPHPLDAFGGSRAFATVARAFWFVAREEGRRLMLWTKGNLSDHRSGLEFMARARSIEVGNGKIEAPVATWNEEPVELTAEDWWQQEQQRRKESPEKGARQRAVIFLQAELADGPKLAEEVLSEAAKQGIRRGTLFAARKSLQVIAMKQTGVPHGAWIWSLPATTKNTAPEPQKPPQTIH